jgi:endonuclease/exonuclease/phosphatase family metal-dependent hydrolase
MNFSCEPIVTTFESGDDLVVYYKAAEIDTVAAPKNLKVITWNIKYAGGGLNFFYDCWGERVLMTKSEVLANLELLAAKIDHLNPDIILIQEIEIDSKRSAYVDQMQYLLNETRLNYGVYSSLWKAQYIPSDGLGRMDLGNAILSKWELTDAERIAFELRTDQDALTQYFYLRRNIVLAQTTVGSNIFQIVNTHISAYSTDGSKQRQLIIFKDLLDGMDAEGKIFIAGGDLNVIPPNAIKRDNFPDSICEDEDFIGDDYNYEESWIKPLYEYYPAIDTLLYALDEEAYFTHTVRSDSSHTRKLDYLFTNFEGGWESTLSTVHNGSEMGSGRWRLSDHAPVSATLILP